MSAIITITAWPSVLLTLLSALVAALLSGSHGISMVEGGIAVLIPNAVFAGLAFRHGGAGNARNIVRSFYLGEALKLVLMATLLVAIFLTSESLKPGALFAGMLVMMVACGVTATRLKTRLPTRRF
ncbi:ATP synthase subunit I [Litorivicinus lipolyticus]|uniref:ATP synthase subunit I n=1 Tax=Litorivicinus lipolyticus TaxID=418701 RepID=UPI0014785BBF|nr:ATP synthase subunit I [Litorivicinus lipolyticus]